MKRWLKLGLAFLPLIIWQFNESGMLITYSIVLPLFLGIKLLPELKRAKLTMSGRNGLIFNREYHFWQTRRGEGKRQ